MIALGISTHKIQLDGPTAYLSSNMQAANRLQKALRTGSGLSFGAWQMLPGSNVSRIIARSGFDWVTVDTEHGNIDGSHNVSIQGGTD